MKVASGASNVAGQLGVSESEARAKIGWGTYKTMIDSAYATKGLSSVTLSGFWRPKKETWNAYATAQGWDNATRKTKLAGISSKMVNGVREAAWGAKHTAGNALDITHLNKVRVANNSVQGGVANVPSIVDTFSNALAAIGASYIANPWSTYENKVWAPGVVAQGHENHLHFGI